MMITIACLGVCRTEVTRYMLGRYQFILKSILFLIMPIWWCLTKSLEESAQTSIYLASDRHLEHVTGKYFRFVLFDFFSSMNMNEYLVIAKNDYHRLHHVMNNLLDVFGSLVKK